MTVTVTEKARKVGLDAVGLKNFKAKWNLGVAALYEEALRRGEGLLSKDGAFVCSTGKYTGRSPNDKFVVKEASSEKNVDWGKVNKPFDPAKFSALHARMMAHAADKDLFVLDAYAGADPAFRLPVRIVTELAWHNMFVRNMFIPENDPARQLAHEPQFTVIDIPSFKADPAIDGTASETFIILSFDRKMVLVGGTEYAGEMKKSIFTVMNYLLPLKDTMPMHCSANIGEAGDTALFFGLSGTGKTTLSSDPHRGLIGDDEHGWSTHGVFNFEGGCYAKTIRLSAEAEPQIYATTKRFGTVLENVAMDAATRTVDFDDASKTENTRCSYPLTYIDNAVPNGQGGHPKNVVMLTADAFGVLPPISRLSPDAAQYHFLSGYTAKVAGTERGIKEPQPNFSTCFGAPFMVWDPNVYAKLLGDRIAGHKARVWLVNTGWTGGPYGVGSRMKIAYTRAMITAALSGALDNVGYQTDPIFNLDVPASCPGVPAEVLNPKNTWKDAAAYDEQAKKLARMFIENFKRFEATASKAVIAAGPRA
jgi:phosphoenolpyruvate carboxykinase (ATP)